MSLMIDQMTIADICIVIVVGFSVLISFLRGFVREAISLAVWVIAILLGLKYSKGLGAIFLSGAIDSPDIRFIVMFLVIFIAVMIVGMIISALLRSLIDKTGLSLFDRLFGVLFGFARGVLVVSMALMFIGMSSWKSQPWVTQSYLIERMQPLVKWLDSYVPDRVSRMSEWVGEKQTKSDSESESD
ncbi:MAG: CvpA family protein [Coxiellaceae bacterium]|nr:CvpA family protein [Coxiellaceae bacterium]